MNTAKIERLVELIIETTNNHDQFCKVYASSKCQQCMTVLHTLLGYDDINRIFQKYYGPFTPPALIPKRLEPSTRSNEIVDVLNEIHRIHSDKPIIKQPYQCT